MNRSRPFWTWSYGISKSRPPYWIWSMPTASASILWCREASLSPYPVCARPTWHPAPWPNTASPWLIGADRAGFGPGQGGAFAQSEVAGREPTGGGFMAVPADGGECRRDRKRSGGAGGSRGNPPAGDHPGERPHTASATGAARGNPAEPSSCPPSCPPPALSEESDA